MSWQLSHYIIILNCETVCKYIIVGIGKKVNKNREVKDMEEVKTFVPSEYKQEAKEVVDFLADLNQEEKKGFLMFMQGIKVAKSMEKKTQTA